MTTKYYSISTVTGVEAADGKKIISCGIMPSNLSVEIDGLYNVILPIEFSKKFTIGTKLKINIEVLGENNGN